MASKERKVIVEELRERGRLAFIAGKSIDSCPYQFDDRYQWRKGYKEARDASLHSSN